MQDYDIVLNLQQVNYKTSDLVWHVQKSLYVEWTILMLTHDLYCTDLLI